MLQDADVPKEAKVVEAADDTSSEPSLTPSESESGRESAAAAHRKEEITESTPPPAVRGASNSKFVFLLTTIR